MKYSWKKYEVNYVTITILKIYLNRYEELLLIFYKIWQSNEIGGRHIMLDDFQVYIPVQKPPLAKIHIYKPLLDVVCKNNPKFHFEGSDGWSSATVRCFAPAEVKASNPFWREQWRRGCLRAASAKRLETPWTKQEHSLGCLHLRLCFFLTKVARIHIRYKEKTLN